ARGRPGTDLRAAQVELERRLAGLDRRFEPTPAGLGVTVAWGLPYFRTHVPTAARTHLPVDVRATRERNRPVSALLDAVRFPSDPKETVLEDNDVAVLLRSDDARHVDEGAKAVFDGFDALEQTSVRRGFVGGGFSGRQSLPKQMAVAAGVAGAELIPDGAQLFLGFTSTQRAAMGHGRIANLETLGYARDPHGYFRGGTTMHLSHVREDLEAWYLNFDFAQRVSTAFRPDLEGVRPNAQTVPQAPRDVSSERRAERGYHRFGAIGHSAPIPTRSRLRQRQAGPAGPGRASIGCGRRRTGRTSSCRRASIARSRSPSSCDGRRLVDPGGVAPPRGARRRQTGRRDRHRLRPRRRGARADGARGGDG